MSKGFVHLTAFVDVGSRRARALKGVISLKACHAREVIEHSFARSQTAEDRQHQGSQFTATGFTDTVLARGCKLSMGGLGA